MVGPRRLLRALLRRRISPTRRERMARAEFWEQARTMTPYVALQHPSGVFILPTAIDPKLFASAGRSDLVVLERACAILRDGGRLGEKATLVDVGAHVGTTTISALNRHGFERAVSIEPDPAHLPLLKANVALNGLDGRVTVVAAAVATTAGSERSFVQGSKKEGSYRWMKGRLTEEPAPAAVAVDTVALDDLAEAGVIDPSATGLLWFDCSSCEERALQAADAFLDRRVPLVFTLRRSQFSEPTPLFARLRDTYEHMVDLRSPSLAEPVSEWTPTFRPVGDLATLPEDRKLTDVLVL